MPDAAHRMQARYRATDFKIACRDHILAALTHEMSLRPEHDDWENRERQRVANAATDWAAAHRIDRTVTVEDVERVEGLAVGHIDYGPKLALYVAELVMKER